MLTGRETVPAAFAATGHRHRGRAALVDARPGTALETTVWGALLTEVRHAALGLAAEGVEPGLDVALDPAAPRRQRAVVVLVASVVGAVVGVGVGDGSGPAGRLLDLGRLAAAGAGVDDRHPDRFEALVAARSARDHLLRSGGVVHTHGSLLVAARSFAQAAGTSAADRLLVDLRGGSAAEIVTAMLVPCLTGASSWSTAEAVDLDGDPPASRPTLVVTGAAVAAPARRRRPARRGRHRPQVVVVAGDGGGPIGSPAGADALAVEAAGGIVTGFGRPGTLGRPLPGASVAVDDDGEVLLRAASIPPAAPGLRDDGWLATGLHGDLDEGHLVLAGEGSALGAA